MGWFDWETREDAQARRVEEFRRQMAEKQRQEEEARQRKLAAERQFLPPAAPRLSITGRPVAEEIAATVPEATRRAALAQGPVINPLEELKGGLRAATGGLTYLGIQAPRPSWLPKQVPWIEYTPEEQARAEEVASAGVAAGPTAFGFGAGAEAALPPVRVTAGATLARLGRPGELLEGGLGRAVSPQVARFRQLLAQETGAVGPLGRAGEEAAHPPTIEDLRAQLGEVLTKREAPPLIPAAGEARIDEVLRAFEAEHRPQWEAERQAAETAAQQREQAELQDFVDRLFAGGRKTSKPRGKVSTPAAGEGAVPPGAPPSGAVPPPAGGYAEYEAQQVEQRILKGLEREQARVGRASEATPEYVQRQAVVSSGGQPPRGTVPPVDATVPNPQAAPRPMQSQVHEANWRLRLALGSADSRDTAIGERLLAGERQLFKFGPDKRIVNVTNKVTGEHPFWNDAFQRPNDYIWPSTDAREYRDTIAAMVKAKTAELRQSGVVFREARLTLGEEWMPRAVEEIRGEVVRGVKRAVGAKQAFQLPRWHEFVESGVANGVDYAKPAATIETFLKAADTAIAHNEYKGIINRFGATGAERIGAEPKQAVIDAFKARNAARAEVGRLQRASLRATGDRETKAVLREQIADAKVTLAESQTALNQARSGKARLMEFARRPRSPTEAYLPEPFAGGRIFPKDVVQQVERGLKPPENAVTSVLKAARDVNNIFRPIWAAADMSYTGLQTAPALGVNPGAWAKMQAVVMSSLVDPTNYYSYVERNANVIDRMIARGKVPWYGSDVMFEDALRGPVGKWVRKGLAVAKPLKIGNDLFGRSLNVTGTELWKQGEVMIGEIGEGTFSKALARRFGPVAKGADAYEQLGSVIAHGTGRMSLQEMAKMGPSTELAVGALPFAGRYWTAWGMLLTDAVRGGMRGNLARRLIAGWAVTGIGVYSLISYALGQEPNLDPREGSKFLTVAVKGGRYGMGGTLHGFMLLAGRLAENPDQAPAILARYARSKSSPVVSLATDLITRETYMGEPLDTWDQRLKYLSQRTGPFAVQSLQRGEGLAQAGATFTGLRGFPQSPYEHLQELVPGWDKMIDAQRKEEAAKNPEVRKWWDKQLQQGLERGQGWAQTKQEVQQQDAQAEQQLVALSHNPQATMADVSRAYGDYLQRRAQQNEVRYADMPQQDPRSDLERRLDAYYAAGPGQFTTGAERDAAFAKQDAMIDADPQLKQAIRDSRILRWKSSEMRTLAMQIEDAKAVRKEYYDIPRKLGMPAEAQEEVARIVAQAQDEAAYSYADTKQILFRWRSMGYITNTQLMRALVYMQAPDNPRREMFRMKNPELKWFENVPMEMALTG